MLGACQRAMKEPYTSCLLGGRAPLALGRGERSWTEPVIPRSPKGLVAGFVLGFVYMAIVNVIGSIIQSTSNRSTTQCRHVM